MQLATMRNSVFETNRKSLKLRKFLNQNGKYARGNKTGNSYASCEITRNVMRAGTSGAMPPPMLKKKLNFLQ